MNTKRILTALLLASLGPVAQAADCDEDQGKAQQVEQKLNLLARLLDDSEPLRRAQQEGNADVLAKIDEAQQSLTDARRALSSGCVADASALSSSGLKLATTAFSKSPTVSTHQLRDSYEVALQSTTTFLLSLESQPQELRGISAEDLIGIERQIGRAETEASAGNFAEAVRLLAPVNDRLQRRLTDILNNKTLYYEKNFATQADEYAYYKEQYEGFLLLLRTGQEKAAYSARNRMDSLLASASNLSEQADQSAAAGAWSDAISKMQEAVDLCEKAIKMTGYSF